MVDYASFFVFNHTTSMKLLTLFIALLIVSSSYDFAKAQMVTDYWGRDQFGDSVHWVFPHDSLYDHREVIIKFRKGILNKSFLCYDCYPDTLYRIDPKHPHPTLTYPTFEDCRKEAMSQRFAVDSGIINDYPLAMMLKSYGGKKLRRMTFANPCHDTLSITRYGDTIAMDHFNWMVLLMDNDTSIKPLLTNIVYYYKNKIQVAEPNGWFFPARIPHEKYIRAGHQKSMTLCGADIGWDFEVGDPSIKVGVIDNGIDWHLCELGGKGVGMPGTFPTYKVIDGWNFSSNRLDPSGHTAPDNLGSDHGTSCASLISANTNSICAAAEVVGVAGGWGSAGADDSTGFGVTLLGLRVVDTSTHLNYKYRKDYIAAAIFLASAYSTDTTINPYDSSLYRYGMGADVLNNSYGYGGDAQDTTSQDPTFLSIRKATEESYQHGVSFVACKQNFHGDTKRIIPADYLPQNMVVAVGASDFNKDIEFYSNVGRAMDLIAPGGDVPGGGGVGDSDYICLTVTDNNDQDSSWFNGTSAATPHVAGAIALLKSFFKRTLPSSAYKSLEPEDYEGILKASAYDLRNVRGHTGNNYTNHYDVKSGWGHLQIDSAFRYLVDSGFSITHVEIPALGDTIFGTWSSYSPTLFFNVGFDSSVLDDDKIVTARHRTITMSFVLPDSSFDYTRSMFIWGKGRGKHFCYSNESPNYQEHFTEILSGTGGLHSTGLQNSPNDEIQGIIHSGRKKVTMQGIQYDVSTTNPMTGQPFGLLPKTSNLGFNFSVFAAKLAGLNDVKKHIQVIQSEADISVSSNSLPTLHIESSKPLVRLSVFDILGREIFTKSMIGIPTSTEVQLPALGTGSYFCRLVTTSGVQTKKFLIAR